MNNIEKTELEILHFMKNRKDETPKKTSIQLYDDTLTAFNDFYENFDYFTKADVLNFLLQYAMNNLSN